MNIFEMFFVMRVDTTWKTTIQPLQGCSAKFEERSVKGISRQVVHHKDDQYSTVQTRTSNPSRANTLSVRSLLSGSVILSNLLLIALPISLLLIVVSLIIL